MQQRGLVVSFLILGMFVGSVVSTTCEVAPIQATYFEQAFNIYKSGLEIPTEYKCNWTINGPANMEVEVSLKVDDTASENQCVQVFNKVAVPICRKADYNKIITMQPVTVIFPVPKKQSTIQNFEVYYKLTIRNSENCGKTVGSAYIVPKKIDVYGGGADIPKNHHCSWELSTKDNKKILVYLTTPKDAAERQCVQVLDYVQKTARPICRKVGNNSITMDQPVTVIYTRPETESTVKNFQIFYKTANSQNCGAAPNEATQTEQSIDVYKGNTDIPPEHQCSWTITGTNDKKVDVYLKVDNHDASDKQCVQVFNSVQQMAKPICRKVGYNSITMDQPVTVIYTRPGNVSSDKNFQLFYKTANSQNCGAAPNEATQTEQSIDVYKGNTDIPPEHQCSWTITGTNDKKVDVYLKVDNQDASEGQCVQLLDSVQKTARPICRKFGNNSITMDQPVTVIYTGPENGSSAKNFQIFYKIFRNSATSRGMISCAKRIFLTLVCYTFQMIVVTFADDI